MLSSVTPSWTNPLCSTTSSRISVAQRPRLARSLGTIANFNKRAKCVITSATSEKLTFYDSGDLVDEFEKHSSFALADKTLEIATNALHVACTMRTHLYFVSAAWANCPDRQTRLASQFNFR